MTAARGRGATGFGPGADAALASTALALGFLLVQVGERSSPLATAAVPALAIGVAVALARPVVAVAGTIAVLPVGTMEVAAGLQLVDLAVVGAIAIVALARLARNEAPLAWAAPLAWLVPFIVLSMIATTRALDFERAVKQEILLVAGALLVAAVLAVCRSLADVHSITATFAAVGGAMCAHAVGRAGSFDSSFDGGVVANRARGVFNQPNELGLFAAMVLMVCIGYFFAAHTSTGKLVATGAVVASGGALLLSLSRGAWMGTVAGVVTIAALLPRARRTLLALGPPIIVAALAFGAFETDNPQVEVVRARLGTIGPSTAANPYDSRPAIYSEAVREIRAEPLTGYGPGNFPVASAKSDSESRTVGAYHAHNALLTVAAELGLPAALILVAFSLVTGVELVRGTRRAPPDVAPVAAGITGALVVLAVHGMVDFPLRNPVVFTAAWMLVGLGLAAAQGETGAKP